MNEKRRVDKENTIGDVNQLETELNDLSQSLQTDDPIPITLETSDLEPSVGRQTAAQNDTHTVDDYSQINAAGFDPDKPIETPVSKEDLLREKFNYLHKLEEIEKKGVNLTHHYNMDSSLQEMQGEYESIMSNKSKNNSIKFQAKVLMACITGIEFLNSRFDPFDVKLDGWSEQINDNLSEYEDVFGELHEKYKSKGHMAPEIKLMFQLAGSAMMIHMTNTMFKTTLPTMDDIMKQNPDMMQHFTKAAVSSMTNQSPNFGAFMQDVQQDTPKPHKMKGPSSDARGDIGEILANMKKTDEKEDETDNSSVSLKELKELSKNEPTRKRGRRKDKEINISLDV